jgi:hypothetical protein
LDNKMAEKHKSKYKAPKDLEKSQKPKARKDLKDYTTDDKDGGMNPNSTKDKQLNVLRKTDKPVQDDGKMYPTYNADDRLYKDLEDGNYDPKTAAKRLKKRQDDEQKDVEDVLQDKIENLTREQKEVLIREYIRRKIAKVLREQAAPEEEAPAEEMPAEDPTALPAAEPGADAAATDPAAAPADPAAAPAPMDATTAAPAPMDAPAAPGADATAGAEAPAEDTPAEPEKELDPAAQEALAIQKFVNHLREKEVGNISRIKAISKVMNALMKDAEPEDKNNFYTLLRQLAISKLQKSQK